MALITCPECGQNVSTNAAACPHCGNPNRSVPPPPPKVRRPRNPYFRHPNSPILPPTPSPNENRNIKKYIPWLLLLAAPVFVLLLLPFLGGYKVMEMTVDRPGKVTSAPFEVKGDWVLEYEGDIYQMTVIRDDGVRKNVACYGSQGRKKMIGGGTYRIELATISGGVRVAAYSNRLVF